MSAIQLKMLAAGLFFLFIFLSGFWVSQAGKPYPGARFNLHKLIGLAAGVFLCVTVYQVQKTSPLSALEITMVAITILLFAGTVVAGGLVSIEKPMPVILSIIHKFLPYIIVLSTASTLYLLLLDSQL
jgi:uncharacterized membrane protein (UPF0136 family)